MEQEAAYPIPISLYNCYRTVRHKRCIATPTLLLVVFLMPHCPLTVVQKYRDGVCSLLFHLFFHPYMPLHLEQMIFYTCFTDFWLHGMHHQSDARIEVQKEMCTCFLLHYWPSLLIPPFPAGSRIFFVMQHAGMIELGPHRYDATLLTSTLAVINRE